LAYWLAAKKKKTVQLIDSAPQKSSSYWLAAMDTRIKAIIMQSPDNLLLSQLE
jgi:cellulose biosynthesis protein BcsQ